MANNYAKASFLIPCSEEQAILAIDALNEITNEVTDVAQQALDKSDSDELTPKERIIRECFNLHPNTDETGGFEYLNWQFGYESTSDGLHIFSDETINSDHAAIFTTAVLLGFDMPDLISIETAYTCSKARPDQFGGSVCVVTKDHIEWGGYNDFVAAEEKAHRENQQYFMCSVTIIDGEHHYEKEFLMALARGTDAKQAFEELCMSSLGEGCWESEIRIEFEDGRAVQDMQMNEIKPIEFQYLSKYLSVK